MGGAILNAGSVTWKGFTAVEGPDPVWFGMGFGAVVDDPGFGIVAGGVPMGGTVDLGGAHRPAEGVVEPMGFVVAPDIFSQSLGPSPKEYAISYPFVMPQMMSVAVVPVPEGWIWM